MKAKGRPKTQVHLFDSQVTDDGEAGCRTPHVPIPQSDWEVFIVHSGGPFLPAASPTQDPTHIRPLLSFLLTTYGAIRSL